MYKRSVLVIACALAFSACEGRGEPETATDADSTTGLGVDPNNSAAPVAPPDSLRMPGDTMAGGGAGTSTTTSM